MKENMGRFWEWIQDRKTHAIRKWRSTVLRRSSSRESDLPIRHKGGLQMTSAQSLPGFRNGHHYEQFFDDPAVTKEIERRGSTFRGSRSSETFPVIAPDLEVRRNSERLVTSLHPSGLPPTPKGTPRTGQRSPRQIRFLIPEVRVSESDLTCEDYPREPIEGRRSPLPPAEIEWEQNAMPSPLVQTVNIAENPCTLQMQSLSMEEDIPPSPRRLSASERARQNLMAQRRQSNVQIVQSMTGRKTSTTLIPLTCAQIHLVRSLWRQMYTTKGPTVIGTGIYHRLCFKQPSVKEQLRRVPLPPKFLNHDSFIKAHSKAVAELIDQVVENLDNLDSMNEELLRLGRLHARLLRGELSGKLWNVVAETFIDCTLEWGDKRCRSETVRKAWALIVAFVVEKIKHGHHEQRKLMLSTRQSTASIDIQLPSLQL